MVMRFRSSLSLKTEAEGIVLDGSMQIELLWRTIGYFLLISASKLGSREDFIGCTGVLSTIALAFPGEISPEGSFCTFMESVPRGVTAVWGADSSTASSDFPSLGRILGVSPMRTLCLQLVAGWRSSRDTGEQWWFFGLRRQVAAFLRRDPDWTEASMLWTRELDQ